MRSYLLPFLLLLLIACNEDENENESLTNEPPSSLKVYCQLSSESYLSPQDSSTFYTKSYFYESARLVKINESQSQNTVQNMDTNILIIWNNNRPSYSLRSENGVVDTLEKYAFDQKGRLIKVQRYINGSLYGTQTMSYSDDRLTNFISESNSITNEFEVRTEAGLIKEVIQLSINGNPVDSTYLIQRMKYDGNLNPFHKVLTGNFSNFSYFNRENLVEYSIYRNGTLVQNASYVVNYNYNQFGYPNKIPSQGSSSSAVLYDYNCAVPLN